MQRAQKLHAAVRKLALTHVVCAATACLCMTKVCLFKSCALGTEQGAQEHAPLVVAWLKAATLTQQ